jgi:hypothetical protein
MRVGLGTIHPIRARDRAGRSVLSAPVDLNRLG